MSSPSGFAPHPHAQRRPKKSGSAESPLFPKKFLHLEGEEVKDEIPVNYKHHFLPQQTEMATWLPGEDSRAAPVLVRDHASFWVGGREALSSPSHLTFLCSSSPLQRALLKTLPGPEEGREKKEGRGSLNPLMHSIQFSTSTTF